MSKANESEQALRALAQALAPYLEEIFARQDRSEAAPSGATLDAQNVDDFVADLPRELTEYSLVLFDHLRNPPHWIDLDHLSKELGAADGREVSGMLLTPLKRRATKAGHAESLWRDSTQPGGARALEDPTGGSLAGVLYQALEKHRDRHHWTTPSVKELLEHPNTRRPLPTSIYVWAPEYAQDLTPEMQGEEGDSSCLRTDHAGTRAVIYQAHEDQGIVAIFDVGDEPKPSRDWGYAAPGRFHILKQPISRETLLSVPELRKVFQHIQGRRRIPASAQEPMKDLLIRQLPQDREAPLALPVFLPLDQPKPVRRRGSTRRRVAG